MKRKLGEIFSVFQKRRREAKFAFNTWRKTGGKSYYFREVKKLPDPNYVHPVSAAVGKRHEGESVIDFRRRRAFCNARRRLREREMQIALSPVGICPHCGKRRSHLVPPSMGKDGFFICEEVAA